MIVLIILVSLALALAAYVMVAAKDKSYFNVLTPLYLTFIPGYYILELLHIYLFGYSGETSTYLFCYATYGLSFLSMAFAYTRFPSYRVSLPFNANHDIRLLPYVILALSVLVYLPVLIEFREFIFEPRQIYIRTRIGYGHMFFISTMLTYLAFILCLFKNNTFRGEKLLFFVISALLCLMHGSKGQVVQLIFMAMMYRVFVQGRRAKLSTAVSYVVAFGVSLTALFFFFSAKGGDGVEAFARSMAGYSDYNRNAMMLIEDDPELHYGQLTLETALYSRVPRVLYPAKPRDWGTFALAKKYYPVWYEKASGSPSFGILGVPYADFGRMAIIYLSIWGIAIGIMLRIFVVRLNKYKNPSDFIMVLFLCSVPIVPGGMTYLLPEHLVLAILIAICLRLRLRKQPSRAPAESDMAAAPVEQG